MKEKYFDVLVVGGGPAGCTAALTLKASGLKVGLIEKASFPRDKICGDAIPGPALKVIRTLNEEWGKELFNLTRKEVIHTSKIVNDKGNSISVKWILPAYNARRIDFDFQLWQMIQEHTMVDCFENTAIKQVKRILGGYELISTNNHVFQTKLLLAADGANSFLAKQLAGFQMDRLHHSAAVRAYVTDIQNIEKGVNLFYLFKKFLPGYFWLFPINENSANVGFGMLSAEISKRKINLKRILEQLITEEPSLKKYFINVRIEGAITGFGLPLGSRLSALSGDHFMLLGDAGSLIDPLQGHGIDKAMISGKLAGEQAIIAFEQNRFDAAFLKQYDENVYRKFRAEFKRNYQLMKVVQTAPWLIDIAAYFDQSRFLKSIFKRWS